MATAASSKFPSIPPPGSTVESHTNAIFALKGAVEQLVGVRGLLGSSAVLKSEHAAAIARGPAGPAGPPGPPGNMADAPADNRIYGRISNAWAPVTEEAKVDGKTYGRKDVGWITVLPTSGGTLTGVLIFNPLPTNAVDDTAAAAAGVPLGGVYRNGSILMVRTV